MPSSPRLRAVWLGLVALALAACAGPAPGEATKEAVEGFMAAWDGEDPEALLAFYSEEVQSYDESFASTPFDFREVASVIRNSWAYGAMEVDLSSYFVSADGRFAVVLGTFALQSGGTLTPQPYASLLAFTEGKITWAFDYYGAGLSGTRALPAFAPTAGDAGTGVAEAESLIPRWMATFNNRDAAGFLECYAEDALYVDLVSPEWRVMAKPELAADLAARFPRAEFRSTLGPSDGSALAGGFLVSPDGRYAAVQGTYEDERTGVRPTLIVLEFSDGAIVRQHNYLNMRAVLLEP